MMLLYNAIDNLLPKNAFILSGKNYRHWETNNPKGIIWQVKLPLRETYAAMCAPKG